MKEKLLSFVKGSLHRMCLLIVMVLAGAGAYAQGWKTLELSTLYNENNIFGVDDKYKFTPETDGTLVVWAQDYPVKVYAEMSADGTDVNYESYCSSFSYESATLQNVTFGKKETAQVKAGTTYYLVGDKGFSKGKKFIAVMETITELTFECDQPLGGMFDITDQRDGQAILTFNLPVTSDQWAYLKVGNYPQDPENGKVEVRSGNNTEQLILNIKEYLTAWKEEGRYNAGDPVTLTLTGVKSRGENPLVYGTDGTLVLKWTAPGDLHKNTSIKAPDPFLSYWLPGDERGIMVLDFDYPLMTMENGQTATVSFTIGSADLGDAYQGQLPQDKISVDGQKLYIDFTGVRRTYADMGLVNKWESISIKVNYIKMEDGTMCFSPSAGNYGSVAMTCNYKEYKSDVVAEFTPANDAVLTGNSFEVYFSDKNAFTFGGVQLDYQTLNDIKYQEIITEGIVKEEGKTGVTYTIPVPEKVKAGKNIRVTFLDQVCNDGIEKNFTVRYNPGPELVNDLKASSSNIKKGDIVSSAENIVLTFDEDVFVNNIDYNETSSVQPVSIYDSTVGKNISATIAAEGKTVTITPSIAFKDNHAYVVNINFDAIVNNEFIETNGKYGRTISGTTINFTVSSQYENYPFATSPLVGSIVKELSVINCTTKPGVDPNTMAISPTRREDKFAYVLDVNKNKVTDCQIKDIVDGFSINLEKAITTPGEYTVVLEDSTFNMGEGYTVTTNDANVVMKYTVLAAPQPVLSATPNPANESKVESINTITLTFDEEVYADEVEIDIVNRTDYTFYHAVLQINPKNRTYGEIRVDNEITAEGTYTIVIPEGSFGDKTWFDNDMQTGKTNENIILYYTIGGSTPGGGTSDWKTDPADGSTVTSIKKIHVWNLTVSEMVCGSGKIAVKKDGVELEKIADTSWGTDWNELIITTSKEYTENGVYTFEVPEGFFLDGSGNSLPAVTFTYTIGNGGGAVTSDWKTDPADGSTVTSLKTIHVWNTTVSAMAGGDGKITVKRDGVELEKISDTKYGEDWNELIISTSVEYTENGTYTFEAPEGFFLDDSGNALPAVTFTYYIGEAAGIDNINADADGKVNVYSLDGKTVKMNATNDELKSLRGIYIINGKKVIRRK